MPIIEVPEHGEVEFPDSMSQDEIISALKKISPPPQEQKSIFGEAKDYASSFAKDPVKGFNNAMQPLSDLSAGVFQGAENAVIDPVNWVLRQQGPKGAFYGKQIPRANYAPDNISSQIGEALPIGLPAVGAIEKAGAEVLGSKPVQKGIGALENSVFRPLGTSQEAREIVESVPPKMRSNLPLGEIVNSVPLQNIQQGVLANIPFSGISKPYEALNQHVVKESQGLMDKFTKGEEIKSPDKHVYEAVAKNYENTKQEVSDAYKKFGKIAEEKSLPYAKEEFDNSIKNSIDELNKKIKISPVDAEEIEPIIDKLEKFKGSDLSSFSNVEEVRKSIGNQWGKAHAEDNGMYKNVLNKLRSAIDSGFEKTAKDDPEALQALLEARNLFKTKQLPFENLTRTETTGKKVLSNEASPFMRIYGGKKAATDDFISKYIKSGKDSIDLTQNLLNKTPEEAKDLIKYGILKSKDEELNPANFIKQYGKYGEQQKAEIFGEDKERLDRLANLAKTYPEIFKINYVPKTGFTGAKVQPWKDAMAKFAVPTGAAYVGATGNVAGLLGLGGLSAGANITRRMLTNPAYREGFLKRMALRENKK